MTEIASSVCLSRLLITRSMLPADYCRAHMSLSIWFVGWDVYAWLGDE